MDFRILGPLEVHQDGRAVPLGGAKQRALLAILLLDANRVVSSDRLIDALWGEHAPETAAKALHVHVSQLRKALEPDRPAGSAHSVLLTRPPGYLIRLEPDQLDLHRFQRLRTEARSALEAGDAESAAAGFRRALGLWRGPPLADLTFEPFATPEIERLEELRRTAVEERVEADLARGRHSELVAELDALVRNHPLRERLRAQLMLALYRSGRQAEALEAYQAAREALVDGLGIDPGPELQRLELAILRQDPELDLRAAEPRRPEGGPPRGRRAAGLFVGRGAELSALRAGLEDAMEGRGRLFLVTGKRGIGKSRLVDELASEAKEQGARVLWGRCWASGDAPPYWPWAQALRSYVVDCDPELLRAQLGRGAVELSHLLPELRELFPDLPPPRPLDDERARFRFYGSTAGLLRRAATAQPLVLVLDDLHAADTSALLLLQFVTAELPEMRILALGAYRDGEPRDESVAAALAELGRLATGRLELTGLTVADIEALVEASAGRPAPPEIAAAVHRETRGNPRAAGELVRRLLAENRLDELAPTPS